MNTKRQIKMDIQDTELFWRHWRDEGVWQWYQLVHNFENEALRTPYFFKLYETPSDLPSKSEENNDR